MDRRKFLKNSALASSVFFVPSFLKAFENVDLSSYGYNKLVVIQLSGGNDGLNTIVPYRNDLYYKARPKIAIAKNEVIKLNDEVGLHKKLLPLKRLYDQGDLSIINNVGYPSPNRSHSRSSAIWHTASDSNKHLQSGWIGRYLDVYGKYAHQAIEIDDNLSIMLKGEVHNGIATRNPSFLYKGLHESNFNKILAYQNSRHLNEHNLGYLYKTMIDAKSSATYLHEKTQNYTSTQNYPTKNPLANQLKTIAQFINSGINTKVYYANLVGFDTHAGQVNTQDRLLDIYANSVAAFVKDLKRNNSFKNTLILTFSEFGRRVKQNAGNGTDHGTANNVFVIGKNLKKQGLYNDLASLSDLDANGDIKYEIDFRTIYATILNKWLKVDDKKILNTSFKHLDFI
ncbi:DUF1501 domain-containing protein [Lacinutrix sp. C3R15]|uniref:DUF1501 domain-containing protein n=1 Tax=Flavobacteriaceae TaxID=49546 RepID=UPI001C09F655|nr:MULTISPECIES: DUF1501 domain-containing protein [Flavobacteriaceae]MBU2937919.1 DUF1501 domain-containing protein [Lacinutrix sp. C3R15]MDO6621233.1 DUF1501 domain-containing protein [Oceanihabitans sp. 1_MG-2023]